MTPSLNKVSAPLIIVGNARYQLTSIRSSGGSRGVANASEALKITRSALGDGSRDASG